MAMPRSNARTQEAKRRKATGAGERAGKRRQADKASKSRKARAERPPETGAERK